MMETFEDLVTFIGNQLKCPICFDMFTDPVTLSCGHSYCLRCVTDHLKHNVGRGCPECRAQLRADLKLHKNVTISNILELHEIGGRKMWGRVLTGSGTEHTQDSLQRKLDFLKQEMEKIETVLAEVYGVFRGRNSEIQEQDRNSSLEREGRCQCVRKNLEAVPEANQASVTEEPDSLRGFSEDQTCAAAVPSAEFVSLSFSSQLIHRRLVFLPQGQRIEVRSASLRTQLCRFDACQCMAEQEFTTGRCCWDVETNGCSGWAAGVAYTHLGRDERLGRGKSSWCIEWSNGRLSAWHDGVATPLKQTHPGRLRVLLDMDMGHLSFSSIADGEAELYHVWLEFRAPVRPVFWLFGTKPGNALSFPKP